MRERKVYKLEIDGVMYPDEYETATEALNAAKDIFAADHSLKEANIARYIIADTQITIKNKDYGK